MAQRIAESRLLSATSRTSDILDRAAVKFTNKKRPEESTVPLKHLRVFVCFIETRSSGLHIVRLAGYTAKPGYIGGLGNSAIFHNAAIGRRMCEHCWRKGSASNPTVHTRGDKVGRCEECDRVSDYLRLSFPPYLRYNMRALDDVAISWGTEAASVADALKNALLNNDTEPLTLPEKCEDTEEPTVVCSAGFIKPIVFNTQVNPLSGPNAAVGETAYNFWDHRGRIADKKAHKAKLRKQK